MSRRKAFRLRIFDRISFAARGESRRGPCRCHHIHTHVRAELPHDAYDSTLPPISLSRIVLLGAFDVNAFIQRLLKSLVFLLNEEGSLPLT